MTPPDVPRFKFPKIWHLPWSDGFDSRSDRVFSLQQILDFFSGREVVVTEKMDGENCSMYSNFIHARSVDGRDHPSRSWVKRLHSRIRLGIPEGWRVCGENLAAKHSIFYDTLPSPFLAFAVYDESNRCLGWDEMAARAEALGIPTVPVLFRGGYDERLVRDCQIGRSSFGSAEQEGYVVRLVSDIGWDQHEHSFAKYVRRCHVQTDEHWMEEKMVWNGFPKV